MKKIISLVFFMAIIMVVFLFFYLVGGLQNDSSPFCLDILDEMDTDYVNGSLYTLTVVTTGSHDKCSFVNLFKGEIKYDKYGNPIYDNVVFSDYIDLGPEHSNVIRNIENGELDIINKKIIINLSIKEQRIFDLSEVEF